jgi:ArsR family transcriptional regulator
MQLPVIDRKLGERCCAPGLEEAMSPAAARQLTHDLEILAHPVRLQLLAVLTRAAGEVCVCDLEAVVPVKQPTVSHHLKLLRRAGIIGCERRGLWAYYFVNRDALSALRARIANELQRMDESHVQ